MVLVATSVFAAVRLPTTRVADLVGDVRWAAFFGANVHFARLGTDYFEQGRAVSPVQHFWSLAVEEQFYLVWPVLLLAVALVATRRRLTVVAVLVSVTWLCSLAWSVALTPRAPTDAYFSSATRAWELATGALLALAAQPLLRLPRPARRLLSVLGLLAILVAAVSYDASTPFPGWLAMLPVVGTAALLCAGGAGAVGAGRLLTLSPLRYLGDISYSLYLWHWPVLVLGAEYVVRSRNTPETAALLTAVLVLSVISYHLVENPIRRWRGGALRGSRALALWPMALGVVLLASGWAGAHARQAFEARIAEHPSAGAGTPAPGAQVTDDGRPRAIPVRSRLAKALRLVDADAPIPFPLQNLEGLKDDLWESRFHCYSSWNDVAHKICPVGDRNAHRTVVLYGNSHAGMWTPALDTLGRRDGYRVVPLVKVGCAPFDVEQTKRGAPYPECPAFRRWAVRRIGALRPDAIVLAYGGLFGATRASDQVIDPRWADGVSSAVRRFHRLAPEVKVISDITNLPFQPGDCITDPRSTLSSCTTREQRLTRVGNGLTRAATERFGGDFVDVTGLVCLRRRCPLVVDRIVTYHDAAHLTRTWTEAVTSDLGRRLRLFPSDTGAALQGARVSVRAGR